MPIQENEFEEKQRTHNKLPDPLRQQVIDIKEAQGFKSLGLHTNKQWFEDPKHLVFSMARYKFVAKMFSGYGQVAEIGCGDGFNAPIVLQEVQTLDLYDIEPLFVSNAKRNCVSPWHCATAVHDITQSPLPKQYEAVYSLDVFEHISPELEHLALKHLCNSINQDGIAIIGMPSLESQKYTKPVSVTGHVNCKSGEDFRDLMRQYFKHVFLFSMNDEVVHTGFSKMAHYIFCLCSQKRAISS